MKTSNAAFDEPILTELRDHTRGTGFILLTLKACVFENFCAHPMQTIVCVLLANVQAGRGDPPRPVVDGVRRVVERQRRRQGHVDGAAVDARRRGRG